MSFSFKAVPEAPNMEKEGSHPQTNVFEVLH